MSPSLGSKSTIGGFSAMELTDESSVGLAPAKVDASE
jgi:hypothetical protein